jgi:hypothetical protein
MNMLMQYRSESVRLSPHNLRMLERRSQHDRTFAREYADNRAQHTESAQAIARLTARVTGSSTANTTNITTNASVGTTAKATAAATSGGSVELSWQELYENYDDRYTLGESQLIVEPADRLDALIVPADLSDQFSADYL